jgi:hypothetical protein
VTDGGRRALIGSEGKREPVLRIAVPGASAEPDEPGATLPPDPAASSPGKKAGAVSKPNTGDDSPQFSGVGNVRVWTLVIGGGLALIVLTVSALMLLSRRRR